MEPSVAVGVGLIAMVLGGVMGWYLREEIYRQNNRRIARHMARSVGARRSTRQPEDMMDYTNRQRVRENNNNGKKARQARVRPRRVFRRPDRRA